MASERSDAGRSALREAGLQESAADQRVESFSKGMRQKVGIAIAMVLEAPAVLLDEPTSGLDPKAAVEFIHLLETLRSRETAVLMATHDLFRARRVCDRIGIMSEGRLKIVLDREELSLADLERVYLETIEPPD